MNVIVVCSARKRANAAAWNAARKDRWGGYFQTWETVPP